MKIEIHSSQERGTADYGWLHTRHSFSFANYYNPKRMGFGKLGVLNEDIIEPGQGFPTHSHDNMEIITIVLEGALEHRDSTGGHGIIKAGEVQRMSAGKGIEHSEYNHSRTGKVHLLQIWVETKEKNIQPGYEQKKFTGEQKRNKFLTIVKREKGKEWLYIHQNAVFSLCLLEKNKAVEYKTTWKGNGVYVFMVNGKAEIEGKKLGTGDAAAVTEANKIEITALEKTELLAIEVPV